MAGTDTYSSFSQLKQYEHEWEIEALDRGSSITVIAPHGGRIEPHTSEIARLIAGEECNLFCFNGTKPGCNRDLHITSHHYDEAQALALVGMARTVIAVHGCTRTVPIILLGGRDSELVAAIDAAMRRNNVACQAARSGYSGTHVNNICNRGSSGAGVQLEISRALRDEPKAWVRIGAAVREALQLS